MQMVAAQDVTDNKYKCVSVLYTELLRRYRFNIRNIPLRIFHLTHIVISILSRQKKLAT